MFRGKLLQSQRDGSIATRSEFSARDGFHSELDLVVFWSSDRYEGLG